MHGFEWTGARGVRLRLWSVATVVREAGAQGSDGEGSAARQKSNDDEGSAARQNSSYGEGNASMHGKYFEASDVHIFFLFSQFANVCLHILDLSDLMVYKAR
jgi:hypothetical protein